MPLQNRVPPTGEIVALAARGTFMGNRGGALHNERREIVRTYASRRWITCVLDFRGRRRTVMSPNRYTELFFLDEAVALSAGHRPCAECRRERFNAFRQAWRASGGKEASFLYADDIDRDLHQARIDRGKNKVTYHAPLGSLPDGCFVRMEDLSFLVWGDALLLWSPDAYRERHPRSQDLIVEVLTPQPIVACLRHGYRPEIHRSAHQLWNQSAQTSEAASITTLAPDTNPID